MIESISGERMDFPMNFRGPMRLSTTAYTADTCMIERPGRWAYAENGIFGLFRANFRTEPSCR